MPPEWPALQPDTLLTAIGLLVLVPLSVLRTRQSPRALRFAAPLLVAAVLGIGWLASEWRGTLAENRARHLLLQRTAAVARSIDPELVKTLRFGPQDRHSAAFGTHPAADGGLCACGRPAVALQHGSPRAGGPLRTGEPGRAGPHGLPARDGLSTVPDRVPGRAGLRAERYGRPVPRRVRRLRLGVRAGVGLPDGGGPDAGRCGRPLRRVECPNGRLPAACRSARPPPWPRS